MPGGWCVCAISRDSSFGVGNRNGFDMRLYGGFYGNLDWARCSMRGVVRGGVMWTVMRDMVVQETPEIPQWSGGSLGFDCGRRGVLLGWGTVWRWSRNGSVWRSSRVGRQMGGPVANGEAELGSHGGVLCCRGAWLRRTTSRLREGRGPRLF
jgi:hypothetical protein